MSTRRGLFGGLRKANAVAFALVHPNIEDPASDDDIPGGPWAPGPSRRDRPQTPSVAPDMPDIFVFTPGSDGHPPHSYCAFKADEPPSPPTPDLAKLHEAMEMLEKMTEGTPPFSRQSLHQPLEQAVPMPRRKSSNDSDVAADPTPLIGAGTSRKGKGRAGRVAKAFNRVFGSIRGAKGGNHTNIVTSPTSPAPPAELYRARQAVVQRGYVVRGEASIVGRRQAADVVDSGTQSVGQLNQAAEPSSFFEFSDQSDPALETPTPKVQKESDSRGAIPRRQPTYPPSSAAQQSTPSLVLNDNQPVPNSARVPYQEKVFRMSTQSLPLRRKGKGRAENRPPVPSEYAPPPPLASPLEITRSSSSTNYSQSPTFSEKTYESPMTSPETIPQSPKRFEAPPNVVLDDTHCTPPMTPPDIISPPSIYSQNSPKVQESIRSSIFSRLSNSSTTRGSPASTTTISPPRSEAFSTPRAGPSRMRDPEIAVKLNSLHFSDLSLDFSSFEVSP